MCRANRSPLSLASAALTVVMVMAQPAAAGYIVIDLHPAGYTTSRAFGIADGQQVGIGSGPGTGGANHVHAVVGDLRASVISLHPAASAYSQAIGVSGGTPGWNRRRPHNPMVGQHRRASDLHPAGFVASDALGTSGGQQVGTGYTPSSAHALLWSGTAGSVIDLHPDAFLCFVCLGSGRRPAGGDWHRNRFP